MTVVKDILVIKGSCFGLKMFKSLQLFFSGVKQELLLNDRGCKHTMTQWTVSVSEVLNHVLSLWTLVQAIYN